MYRNKVVIALKKVVGVSSDEAIEVALKDLIANWDKHMNEGSWDRRRKPVLSDLHDIKKKFGAVSVIYRCIGLDLDEGERFEDKIDFKNLGVYWSYDRSQAICHWGKDEPFWATITAQMPEEVNWTSTILQYLTKDRSEELEVTLEKGAPIVVQSIEIEDDNFEIIETLRPKKKSYA